MAAMITETDGVVLNREKAWHGLGIVVQEDMSPTQAMAISGLGWTVSKSTKISATVTRDSDSYEAESKDYSAVIRDDNKSILSIMSPDYKVVQNSEVFDLAYSLDKNIKVESALSMDGGRRLVVLCRAGEIRVGNNDALTKFMALVNSHDGTISLSALPTSIRIVCSNTLSMAMAEGNKKAFRVVHSGDMVKKREGMAEALKRFTATGKLFEDKIQSLARRELTKDEIQKFWLEVWAELESPVVLNPQTEEEKENKASAIEAVGRWSNIFDAERQKLASPASLWMAANAVTNDLQHKVAARGRKSTFESAAYSNLMGANQDRTIKVMKMAIGLAA